MGESRVAPWPADGAITDMDPGVGTGRRGSGTRGVTPGGSHDMILTGGIVCSCSDREDPCRPLGPLEFR
jgi:hypothetical protein